jgi:lipopolysaccharide transport system ATP-binding protein
MSKYILKVEELGKRYRLGVTGTRTLSEDLRRYWSRISGQEYSNLSIEQATMNTDEVWALNNISFEVKSGEAMGIIGKNGAGKSTLLKILSKVTLPTKGRIRYKGRIASLLEVGTGFHGELTGRENIYLNGAILGMNKQEIKSKFDEIVAFSGVEKYIDTPVKRYSSGMYVRLAFSVAAHLEPEILIVDEVLAVGDASFQKSCVDKMKDVSGKGRTVLFVSHNMSTIGSLCERCLLLDNGNVAGIGSSHEMIAKYLAFNDTDSASAYHFIPDYHNNILTGTESLKLIEVKLLNENREFAEVPKTIDKLLVEISYEVFDDHINVLPNINLHGSEEQLIFTSIRESSNIQSKGRYITTVEIPEEFLNAGSYRISLEISLLDPYTNLVSIPNVFKFEVFDHIDSETRTGHVSLYERGLIRPRLNWTTKKLT